MSYKRLFILVEGNDDERFFERIIRPKFEEKYDSITPWKYAQKKNKEVIKFLKSIEAMRADYIYTKDFNSAPCITKKKQRIQIKIKNINKDRIIVVIEEIESWYLAGLDNIRAKIVGVRSFKTTDTITKEQFISLMPKKYDSKIDFMSEILNHFSIEIARRKNRSFSYFINKHDC